MLVLSTSDVVVERINGFATYEHYKKSGVTWQKDEMSVNTNVKAEVQANVQMNIHQIYRSIHMRGCLNSIVDQ